MKAAADRCKQSEKTLIQNVLEGCDTGEEAMFIEFQVDDLNAFVAGGAVYTKEKSSSGPKASKEVNFKKLSADERENFNEAMAKEASEVLRSQALRRPGRSSTRRP